MAESRQPVKPPDLKLTARGRRELMACVLRFDDVFNAAVRTLRPGHFGNKERHLAAVWEAALRYESEHKNRPRRASLMAVLDALRQEDKEFLYDEEYDKALDLMETVYDTPSSDLDRSWGFSSLSKLLEVKLTSQLQEAITDVSKSKHAVSVPSLLSRFKVEADSIASLRYAAEEPETFPSGWSPKGLRLQPTGLSFFDSTFLSGGQADGEVYGLMGPIGSCKTTLGIQLAVLGARRQHLLSMRRQMKDKDKGRWIGCWFIFSYEAPLDDELRVRTMSCAAQVSRKRLSRMAVKDMSTSKRLAEYEKKLFSAQLASGQTVPGEQERIAAQMPIMNRHLQLRDMTGSKFGGSARGRGASDEVVLMLSQFEAQHKDCYVAGVVVDYVNLMIKRHLMTVGKPLDHLRHYVTSVPDDMKSRVAGHFDCPVWLIQQLDTKSNAKAPGYVPHYTDAGESKNFAENCDFCIAFGTQTAEQLCVGSCSKHRREPPSRDLIVKLEGDLARVVDTNGKYCLDSSARRIVRTDEFKKIAGHGSAGSMAEGVNL